VPIYIQGVEEWNSDILDQAISVTGVLRLRKLAPDPVVGEHGEHSAGAIGNAYVLEDAKWAKIYE
jgi:hypothetical protein